MRYELRLTAYDCMDEVVIHWTLDATDPDALPPRRSVLSGHESLSGVGEDDPLSWVRDALIGALEPL